MSAADDQILQDWSRGELSYRQIANKYCLPLHTVGWIIRRARKAGNPLARACCGEELRRKTQAINKANREKKRWAALEVSRLDIVECVDCQEPIIELTHKIGPDTRCSICRADRVDMIIALRRQAA